MESALKKGFVVDSLENKSRLDILLAKKFPEFSRSFFKNLIIQSHVTVNNTIELKAGRVLVENDYVEFCLPDFLNSKNDKDISGLNVELVYEHPEFLIINKGAGVLVHATNDKNQQITLVDWLIQKFKDLVDVGSVERPGIVHRLDMNTSGLMVIPRTNLSHKNFGDMFKDRKIKKRYIAIVHGHPDKEGIIDFNIVRHPVLKHKMTHVPKKNMNLNKYSSSREAITEYKVLKYFKDHSLVEAFPKTGRTHQIRVHFAAIGHPLLGDETYGQESNSISRHALHAAGLSFEYNGQQFLFEQELPEDMKNIINLD